MIYQIYGFNMVCDCMIEALKEYSRNRANEELPTVTVSRVDRLCDDMNDGVKVAEDYADAIFTNNKCNFSLVDGLKIQISSNNIIFCRDRIDSKRVGEELDGPALIVLSRYHKRAVLHGSAFLYKGKAYLLMAYPGAGKSTLAMAMTKYYRDIFFLTDDIICVEKDGSAMFRGMHSVNLNDDSMHGLRMWPYNHDKIRSSMGVNSDKTVCNIGFSFNKVNRNRIPLGGIIFLGKPITEDLIQIRKLDFEESFYESIRNIKLKKL